LDFARLRTDKIPLIEVARSLTPPFLWSALYRALVVKNVPDGEQYKPHYSPWLAPWFRELHASIAPHTTVSIDRCWTLWQGLSHASNVEGDVLEAGVFQGGTAKLLDTALNGRPDKALLLFDSFGGMKETSDQDRHAPGDFADTSLEHVQSLFGDLSNVSFYPGWIPDTFRGLENHRFCFAHVDLDLYQGILDTLTFVYPRMSPGGVIVFDDYGFASCPGARKAVDEFFADKREKPLALSTSQAVIHKL
jgi:O-methyltransferase